MKLRIFYSAVMLALTWLVWSGLYKPLLLSLGALSCLLVLFLTRRMGFFSRELFGFRLFPRLPGYWLWLLVEIIKSNIDVARAIVSPRKWVNPTTVSVPVTTQTPLGKAILGNSNTLTPGSLTLDVHEGEMIVHCLTHAAAKSLASGQMDRRVARLTRK